MNAFPTVKSINIVFSSGEVIPISINSTSCTQDVLDELLNKGVIDRTSDYCTFFHDEELDNNDNLYSKGVTENTSDPFFIVRRDAALNQIIATTSAQVNKGDEMNGDVKKYNGDSGDDGDDKKDEDSSGDVDDESDKDSGNTIDDDDKSKEKIRNFPFIPFPIRLKTTDGYDLSYDIDHTTTVANILEWLFREKCKYFVNNIFIFIYVLN